MKKLLKRSGIALFLLLAFSAINAGELEEELFYKGVLYRDQPKEIDGFTFQANIITIAGWGSKKHSGKIYLHISKGEERFKRKIEVGKEYFFDFKETCLCVRCIDAIFVLPESISVEISRVKKAEAFSICSFKEEDYSGEKSLLLSNGLIRLRVLPKRGGRIIEFFTSYDNVNHLCLFGKFSGGIDESEHSWPGSFHNQVFSYQVLKDTPEEIKILLKTKKPIKDLMLEKVLILKKGEYRLRLEIKEYNYKETVSSLSLHLHPELSIGGSVGSEDTFFVPVKKEIKVFPFSPLFFGGDARKFTVSQNWAACADTTSRLYYIASYSLSEVEKVGVHMGAEHYNLGIYAYSEKVKPKEYLPLNISLCFVKGLSGIDNYSNGIASYFSLPGKMISQDKAVSFTIELGTDLSEEKQIKGELSLYQKGKKIKDLVDFKADLSFEEPLKKSFSFSWQDLSDGEYDISLAVFSKKGKCLLKMRNPFFLIGSAIKKNLNEYNVFKKKLNQLKKKYPAKYMELFEIFVNLEQFRAAVEENKTEEISLKRKEVEQALEEVKKSCEGMKKDVKEKR